MTILIARHGETDWNRELRFQGHADPSLNDEGRRQARALAERLADAGIAAIYASPLRRALETAEIVARRLGLEVAVDERLREVDVGSWEGLTRADLEERFPDEFRRWIDGGPGWEDGESYDGMAERVAAALDDLAGRHRGETILVVSHGGPVRATQARALGITFAQARGQGPPLHNCGLFAADFESRSFRRID